MGDVINLKDRTKERKVKEAVKEMDDFYTVYESDIEMVEELTNDLLFDLDIKEAYNSDVFLLREAIMAVHMRNKGIAHPFHTFVDNMVSPLLGLMNPVEFEDGEDETDNS